MLVGLLKRGTKITSLFKHFYFYFLAFAHLHIAL